MDDLFKTTTLEVPGNEAIKELFERIPDVTISLPVYEELVRTDERVAALLDYVIAQKTQFIDVDILCALLGVELPKKTISEEVKF